MSGKAKSTKVVHALRSPYPEPSWPIITSDLENTFLDILIPSLLPIGTHRKDKFVPSKRSRTRKRRKDVQTQGTSDESQEKVYTTVDNSRPVIQDFLTIGFNSTVQYLETLANNVQSTSTPQQEDTTSLPVPVAVLVCVTSLPTIMTTSLPLLAAMASRAGEQDNAVRLVPISEYGASRIAEATSQPRASIIGQLPGAPGLKELETLIRENVKPMDVPWIREASSHTYQALRIHSEEVVVNKDKLKGEKRKREMN